MAATACAHEQLAGTSFYKFQRRKLENTKTEFIMKTISAVAIAAIIGSVAMHGADARLGRRLSPFGNGQSGRGPSPFDPSKGWWDDDQSVDPTHVWDPTQGWWDEADQSVGSPFGNGQSGRGPSPPSTQRKAGGMKQTKVSAVRLVMANLAAVQAPSTHRKAGGMKQTKVSAVRLVMANLAAVQGPIARLVG